MGASWAKWRIFLLMDQKWRHNFHAPPREGHSNSLATLVSTIFSCEIYLQNHPKLSYGRLRADEGRSTLAGFVFQLNTAFAIDQILIFIFCKFN